MMKDITVAIRCAVYNHEPYISDCLNGFVMQKTNFKFVAIVHDDASTDGSAQIIRGYAEKYPDIIKPIYETDNQYSKGDGSIDRIINEAIVATGAKYIALCEGDDYWTDPYKLQKQVDYMESHPDCSCHAHNSLLLKTATQQIALFNKRLLHIKDYELGDFLNKTWFTPTQSLLFRRDAYTSFEDMPPFIHGDYTILVNVLLKKGSYLHYSDEIMGVYRDGGWASTNYNDKEILLCDDFISLLNYFKAKSNHLYDLAFDNKINEQLQLKKQAIINTNSKSKSRSFITRIWHKIRKLLCLEN